MTNNTVPGVKQWWRSASMPRTAATLVTTWDIKQSCLVGILSLNSKRRHLSVVNLLAAMDNERDSRQPDLRQSCWRAATGISADSLRMDAMWPVCPLMLRLINLQGVCLVCLPSAGFRFSSHAHFLRGSFGLFKRTPARYGPRN